MKHALTRLPPHLRSPFYEVVFGPASSHPALERAIVGLAPVLEAAALLAWCWPWLKNSRELCLLLRMTVLLSGLGIGWFTTDVASYCVHYTLDNGGRLATILFAGLLQPLGLTFNRVHDKSASPERAFSGQFALSLIGLTLALLSVVSATYYNSGNGSGSGSGSGSGGGGGGGGGAAPVGAAAVGLFIAEVAQGAALTGALASNLIFESHRLAHMNLRRIEPRLGGWSLTWLVRPLQVVGVLLQPPTHRLHHNTQHGPLTPHDVRCAHWGLLNGGSDRLLDLLFAFVRPGEESRYRALVEEAAKTSAREPGVERWVCRSCTLVNTIVLTGSEDGEGGGGDVGAVVSCHACGGERGMHGYRADGRAQRGVERGVRGRQEGLERKEDNPAEHALNRNNTRTFQL